MPVDCVAIRDASLTTKFRVIQALSAYRQTYKVGAGAPTGFPVGNTFWPEQFRNTVSAEVPLLASQGRCDCDPTKTLSLYGFQAPVNSATNAGNQ